jgi:hypothetical protein
MKAIIKFLKLKVLQLGCSHVYTKLERSEGSTHHVRKCSMCDKVLQKRIHNL